MSPATPCLAAAATGAVLHTALHTTMPSRLRALATGMQPLVLSTCKHTALCLLYMQNSKGKPAKGATAQEFADFMAECLPKAWLAIGQHQWSNTVAIWPLFCFDKPKIHVGQPHLLHQKGIPDWFLFPQPRYGPDFNKAIEHIWGIIAAAYREWLRETTGTRTAHECRDQLMHLLSTRVKQDSVMRDVRSLPDMWANIAGSKPDGTEGGYADRPHR
jgi:hypothetical protein